MRLHDFYRVVTFLSVDTIEIYDYHEDDIVVMTNEEENKETKRWPSKENIVGSSS